MNIGIIVQARFSSRRLPGKVLTPIHGKPMLAYLLEKLDHTPGLPPWLLATSNDASDDPIAAFCQAHNFPCYRGKLDDVAGRFLAAARAQGWEHIVRISGDSPLMDTRLIQDVLALYQDLRPDLASNVQPRSFPRGMSVEVFRAEALERLLPQMTAEDREHVTPLFYKADPPLRIAHLHSPVPLDHLQLAVDTPEDLALAEGLIGRMTRPHWEYDHRDIVGMLDEAL